MSEANPLDKLSPRERGILGLAANGSESFFDLALFSYKVHSQLTRFKALNTRFSFHPSLLFAGWKQALPAYGIVGSLQTWADRKIEHLFAGNGNSSTGQRAISSLLGGAISSPFLCSIELILTQLQMKMKKTNNHKDITFVKVFRNICNEHGLRHGIFRGTSGTLGRDSLFTYGYIEFPRTITPYVKKYCMDDIAVQGLSTAISAIVMTVLSQPFDTIKTVMQGDMKQQKFVSFIQTSKVIYTMHGWKGFMFGLNARFTRTAFAIFYLHLFMDYGTKWWNKIKSS